MKTNLYLPNGAGDPTQHNYFKKMIAFLSANPELKSELCRLQIQHDDWCDLLNERGFCNCDPDIIVKKVKQ